MDRSGSTHWKKRHDDELTNYCILDLSISIPIYYLWKTVYNIIYHYIILGVHWMSHSSRLRLLPKAQLFCHWSQHQGWWCPAVPTLRVVRKAEPWPQPAAAAARSLGSAVGQGENMGKLCLDYTGFMGRFMKIMKIHGRFMGDSWRLMKIPAHKARCTALGTGMQRAYLSICCWYRGAICKSG